jgi:hypothetical protein
MWRSLAESNRSLHRERDKNWSMAIQRHFGYANIYRDNCYLQPWPSIDVQPRILDTCWT